MKRRDLVKKINQLAKDQGTKASWEEGKKHTKVELNGRATTVPRHTEINELTAQGILKFLEGEN